MTDKFPLQDWGYVSFCTSDPNAKTASTLQMLATHWSRPKTRAHHHGSIRPSQDWGFLFFNRDAKTYMSPEAGDPSVKPEGTGAYHHGHICTTKFVVFLDFSRVGGPTPPGLGVTCPNIVQNSPGPRHKTPFVTNHLVSYLHGVHQQRRI